MDHVCDNDSSLLARLKGEAQDSQLQTALDRGEFALTADLLPPKSGDLRSLVERLRCLVGRVTAVNVADMPSAQLAQGAWAASMLLLELGIEPILQMTCRDRILLALQADLLAANAVGIRDILVL